MASHAGAALISDLTGRAVSKVVTTLSDRSGVDEKLRRLSMLVIKLRSTVEVSEKFGTETASLLEWRDKLEEAAAEGHQVFLSFQERATAKADADTKAAKGQHQDASTSSIVSVMRKVLEDVARGVWNAAALLPARGEGADNLNSTVDRLEKVCADVGEFIRLHQAEASIVKAVQRLRREGKRASEGKVALERASKLRRAAAASSSEDDDDCWKRASEVNVALDRESGPSRMDAISPWSPAAFSSYRDDYCTLNIAEEFAGYGTFLLYSDSDDQEESDEHREDMYNKIAESLQDGMSEEPATTSTATKVLEALGKECAKSTAVERLEDASANEEDGLTNEPAMSAAVKRLSDAVAEITRAVEIVDGRDLSGLECLAEWADVLQKAKVQGHAIVSDAEACKQAEEGHDEDLLSRAVQSMENLALDVGWFTSLVSLCTPTK